MNKLYDKSKLKDSKGRYLTQGLFLENKYDADMAIFTYDGEDKLYKDKTYYSLKRLYLEEGDPNEYLFANTFLYDWDHWQRLCNNVIVRTHIDKWREELELRLISEGVSSLIHLAVNENSFQAAKYLADKGWDKSKVGRPSKEAIEGQLKKAAAEREEFGEGVALLSEMKRKIKK